MKQTLGRTLKEARKALGLTQRQLSSQLRVKPSYVVYLENDQRRPSLPLLNRLARTLKLEQEKLFLLAHPEARPLLFSARRPRDHAWRTFVENKALLVRYNVQPRELRVLARINRLGQVIDPRDFLFILNSIRQAVDTEE
jgi:transcriptional regulator with XRE-family HTH domain